MNPIDIIVLLLLILGLFSGARAGFFGPVLGLAGAVGGFAFALFLATVLRDPLGQVEQPMRALVTLAGLAAFVLMGEALGGAIGANLSLGLRRSLLQPFDAIGGAIVGAAHVVLFVWLAGGMLAAGMVPWLGPTVRDSVALRLTDAILPRPLAVLPVVGDVEAAALEDEPGAAGDHARTRTPADRTFGHRLVAHLLEQVEAVPLGAPVFVGRHGSAR